MRRLTVPLLSTALLLLFAAPAIAGDNGEGLLGETNDKIITFFSLGVVCFFTFVVCFGSWLQGRLDRRKQARKAAEMQQRTGW